MEINTVVKNIYSSCDIDNTNSVQVLKLIDFIKPYFTENLGALNSLRQALDPDNVNIKVSSETFYSVMNEWSKKIGSGEDEDRFNRTPSQLDTVDDVDLPYTQSTPRASYGQQLLNGSGLLNLSNVSSYSLNCANPTIGADKTMLEEEIKELQHQLNKVTNEMDTLKYQLVVSEEQNEMLQTDLDRLNRRLLSEQQVNEHLQRDKKETEDLREELNKAKFQIELFRKKLQTAEKDNEYLNNLIKEIEHEKRQAEKKYEDICQKENEAKMEIFDVKTEIELKEQEIATLMKINDDMKNKLSEQKDMIEFYSNERELLKHKKDTLEKALKGNLTSRSESLLSQYHSIVSPNFSDQIGTIQATTPPFISPNSSLTCKSIPHNQKRVTFNTPNTMRMISNPVSPTMNSPIYHNCSSIPQKNSSDGISPRTQQEGTLLKQVLMRNTSTPNDEGITEIKNSPPVMYIVHRSPDVVEGEARDSKAVMPTNTLPHFVKDSVEMSSDDDFAYWELQDAQNDSPHESLMAEMSQALTNRQNPYDSNYEFEQNEKMCELETELKSHQEKIAEYENEMEQLKIDNLSTVQKLDYIEKEKNKLYDEVTNLKTIKSEMEEKLTILQQEKIEIQRNLERVKDEKDKLSAALKKSEQVITDIDNQLREVVKERDEIAAKNHNLINDNESLTGHLKEKNKKLEELEKTLVNITQIETNIATLESTITEKDKEILNLKKNMKIDMDFKKGLQDKLQSEIFEKGVRIQELDQNNAKLREELEKTKSEYQQEIENNKLLNNLNNNIEHTLNGIQLSLNEKISTISELKCLNNTLNTTINEMESHLSQKFDEIRELRSDIENEIMVKNSLWQNIRNLKEEVEEHKRINQNLIEERTSKLSKVENDHKEEIETLSQEVSTFKQEILNQKNRLNEQEEKLQKLNEKIFEEENKSTKLLQDNVELIEKLNFAEKVVDDLKLSETDMNGERNKIFNKQKETIEELQSRIQEYENLFKLEKESESNLKKEYKKLKDTSEKQASENYNIIEELKKEKNKIQSDLDEVMKNIEVCLIKKPVKCEGIHTLIKLLHEDLEEKNNLIKERDLLRNNPQSDSTQDITLEKKKSATYSKQQVKMERLLEKYENALKVERNKVDTASANYTLVKEDLALVTQERDDLIREKNVVVDRLNETEKQFHELKTTYEEKIFKQNLEIERLEEDKVRDQNNLENATSQLRREKEKYDQMKKDFIEKCEALFEVEHDVECKQNKIIQIEEDAKKLKEEKLFLENRLQKEESKNENLKKMVSDLSSKSDDYKEMSEKYEQLKGTKGLLESTEMELNVMNKKLKHEKEELGKISYEVLKELGVVIRSKKQLQSATIKVLENWRDVIVSSKLRNEKCDKLLKKIENEEDENISLLTVENTLKQLENQVNVTTLLLEFLAFKCPKHMENLSDNNSLDLNLFPSDKSKMVKKFTLRPSRLIVSRPVSPDSPSTEVSMANELVVYKRLEDSTDHQNPDSASKSFQSSFVQPSDETYDTASEGDKTANKIDDIPYQEASPNVSDPFLERLGLHENSPLKKLSNEETERLFTALVIQISLDSKDIKDRHQKQRHRCENLQENFRKLIKEVTSLLREHRCIGAQDTVKPVFVLLEEMKFVLKDVVNTASQYGVLSYELRMMKSWNLVTNYMAMLRQETRNGSFPCTKMDSPTQTVSPDENKMLRRRIRRRTITTEEQPAKRQVRARISCCGFFFLFSLTLISVVLVFVQWTCRSMAKENYICPLDMIVQLKTNGPPPH